MAGNSTFDLHEKSRWFKNQVSMPMLLWDVGESEKKKTAIPCSYEERGEWD